MKARTDHRGESGQALIYVLVLTVTSALLATALLGLASTAAQLAQRVNQPLQARVSADQGVEYGIHQVIEQGAAANFAESTSVLVPGSIKEDIVSINVSNVPVTSLTISPATDSVAVGTARVFTATALSGGVVMDGQSGRPGFAPVWTVTDASDAATTKATISPAGRFVRTASEAFTAPETFKVKVVVNNVSAFATVTVTGP